MGTSALAPVAAAVPWPIAPWGPPSHVGTNLAAKALAQAQPVNVTKLVDVQRAILVSNARLDQAEAHYKKLAATVGSDVKTNVTLTFGAGNITTSGELHRQVAAMGVTIITRTAMGLPGQAVAPPSASVIGNDSQPGLQVTWATTPSLQKTTVQMNLAKGTIAFKGQRGPLQAHISLILTFFGNPMSIKGAADGARSTTAASVNIRDLLQ